MVISICYNLSALEAPFDRYKIGNIFKIYMNDTGLFVSMLEPGTAGDIIPGNLGIYKGALYENIVSGEFVKQGRELYYFSKSGGLEIDFITKINRAITLVETKVGNDKICIRGLK